MRIEQGFVAATPDGQFLQWWQVSTHMGYRTEFATTTDIDDASFSRVPVFSYNQRHSAAPEHNWVPVERRTEITLKGYGT